MSLRSFLEEMEKRGEVVHVRGSTLDPSADQETGLTTKLGIDATHPLTKPHEKFERAKIPTSKRIAEMINEMRKDEKSS